MTECPQDSAVITPTSQVRQLSSGVLVSGNNRVREGGRYQSAVCASSHGVNSPIRLPRGSNRLAELLKI